MRRPGEDSFVNLSIAFFKTDKALESFLEEGYLIQTKRLEEMDNTGFSGLPAGPTCYRFFDPKTSVDGGSLFGLRAGRVEIHGQVTYMGSGPRGKIVWSGKDKEGTREAMEGAVRGTMANYLGSLLSKAEDQVVLGRRMAGRRNDAGTIYVPLDDWAAARGLRLTYNKKRGSALLQSGSNSYILALSAAKIKVGAAWRNLDGFVLRVGDDWLAPLAGLEKSADQ